MVEDKKKGACLRESRVGTDQEEAWGKFWGDGDVRYLDRALGDTGNVFAKIQRMYIICAFHFMWISHQKNINKY